MEIEIYGKQINLEKSPTLEQIIDEINKQYGKTVVCRNGNNIMLLREEERISTIKVRCVQ